MSGLNSKIIVLGSTGMLGRYMYNYMKHVHGSRCIGVNRQHFDARDLSEDYFKELICKGAVVINCVGIVKPYISTVGQIDTIKINSIFPQMIANVCSGKNAKFIQICSDCVFSGRKGSYIETDIPDAQDLYAKTKSIEPTDTTIIRTSFVGEDVNEDGTGLLQWIISQKGKEISGYDNCMWNGITCLQLAKTINRDIIENNRFWTGVRHIFSPEVVSKYELCNIVNDVYNLRLYIKRSHAEEIQGTKIERALDRSLSTIYDNYNYHIPLLKKQLIEQQKF